MPWKECDKVSERVRFISRHLNGETMTDLCREFGISRVTGYKILRRYEQEGIKAFNDRSSRPWKLANKTPASIETLIIEVKEKYPTWGAPKILSFLKRRNTSLKLPACSTTHAILDRHGFVQRRPKRRKFSSFSESLIDARGPNELWCADFKGHFKMGDGRYCYPLTISDHHSRFLLCCEAQENPRELGAIEVFKRIFEQHGLPDRIRTDNGVPFSSRTIFGLSKLSILWLRLGIKVERIAPGHPEQNGRHERMHRTLKQATASPPGENILQQQEIFEGFMKVYNEDRPHESLAMRSPADIYRPSKKVFPKLIPEFDYSNHEQTRRVSKCGSIKAKGDRKIFISDAFAGQELGISKVDEEIWSVDFLNYRLGYFGLETNQFSPASDPFSH